MLQDEVYFTPCGTESDHWGLESMLIDASKERGVELRYYRKFKTGHVPTWRECKIVGPRYKIMDMLKDLDVKIENYWQD